ncbi:hypothetical protein EMIHUDRAFT_239702 [Emiliania huxleyi CCMP1516]|uniref:Uncharacterized protein n=2 Tax=Emiliania huxleyi TaxID=2903 RepID=A0A0D3JIU0_EMIH1|nr:hypothetical protein EMIHUDRAFT_239702 [Emiliania huxleyi CCMP1516]EOD23425.1 hypothetical protein EMIHUDRAFT_239702 [Emiliania huxleyi CCMP1516]|eukprot:XP_005775854.1 hypothetical protein EMIHUDRAFT_239702 [Emiliania huxleyi CCMP1516]
MNLWEAAEAPPESDLTKQIVAVINYDTHEISYAYAEVDSPPQGQAPTITYHELWLDTSNRPHRTGNTIDPTGHMIASTEFDVNFDLVFGSFGTELSDATEERQWRKYVHRALNVRNRNPAHLEDKKCRLCGVAEESMLHLVECMHCKPLWKKCLTFCRDVLEGPVRPQTHRAIIFNQENYDTLLPEAACAFIRHAFNIFYHDFANVDKGFMFIWQRVYYRALTSFRSAVRRYGGKIRLQYTHRLHTSLTEVAGKWSQKTTLNRKKFASIISIDQQGNSTLNDSFTAAIDQAYSDLKAEENRQQPRRL